VLDYLMFLLVLCLVDLFFVPLTSAPAVYTLSLHDALPIFFERQLRVLAEDRAFRRFLEHEREAAQRILTASDGIVEPRVVALIRSEEHTSELQSRGHLVCRLLLEKKKKIQIKTTLKKISTE